MVISSLVMIELGNLHSLAYDAHLLLVFLKYFLLFESRVFFLQARDDLSGLLQLLKHLLELLDGFASVRAFIADLPFISALLNVLDELI